MSNVPNLRDQVERVNKIADGVIYVAKAMKDLQSSKLNEKALLILLSHSTGMSQKDVKKVLDGLAEIEKMYVKKT